MKTITVHQPYASLITLELKIFEFRSWKPGRHYINQRIAIHAGARSIERDHVIELIRMIQLDEPVIKPKRKADALDLLERILTAPAMLPRSAVVCTAFLGRARNCTEMFGRQVHDCDWAWPLTNVERLEPPVKASGKQGFWDWTPPARDREAVSA